jgi:uncharacterized protein YqgQ
MGIFINRSQAIRLIQAELIQAVQQAMQKIGKLIYLKIRLMI